ncbi:hypothetical protein BN12_1170011 [Nostocoides japonicum T1-X7]|uniref:Uncharacterized protein n=1 Tax=Nostocoides japonicum T1-X7 TaxID=1194083 RepID=A0A077LUG5_9MICO|nr:hypothetical protein BN12_1170011 [Tetrasphaera japonica T1-X7]
MVVDAWASEVVVDAQASEDEDIEMGSIDEKGWVLDAGHRPTGQRQARGTDALGARQDPAVRSAGAGC